VNSLLTAAQASIELAIREYNTNIWQTVGGMSVPGTIHPIDSFLFAILMGNKMANATPDQLDVMRQWDLTRWTSEINDEIIARAKDKGISISDINDPTVPPPWLTRRESISYERALDRSGELIKDLGEFIEDDVSQRVGDVWESEQSDIDFEEEAQKRDLDVLPDELAEAVVRGRTSEQLATDLGTASGNWNRNWHRIARTELQGVYNEATVIESLEIYGEDARVARTPDQTACIDCRRVFLQGDTPIVFNVADLVANDTNAGRKRQDWLPTIWPVHPNCRCGVQVIPPGFTMDENWDFVPIEDEEIAA